MWPGWVWHSPTAEHVQRLLGSWVFAVPKCLFVTIGQRFASYCSTAVKKDQLFVTDEIVMYRRSVQKKNVFTADWCRWTVVTELRVLCQNEWLFGKLCFVLSMSFGYYSISTCQSNFFSTRNRRISKVRKCTETSGGGTSVRICRKQSVYTLIVMAAGNKKISLLRTETAQGSWFFFLVILIILRVDSIFLPIPTHYLCQTYRKRR